MNEDKKQVDKLLDAIYKEVVSVYTQALKSARGTADKYFDGFSRRDAAKKRELEAKEISQDEYKEWRKNQMLTGSRYNEMVDVLAKDLTNADKIASSVIGEHMPDAYAIGHNYGTFEVEKSSSLNTSYTLYDRLVVERLIREGDVRLRPPKPDIPKDERWNRQHINSVVTQAVLQGKSVGDVSKELRKVASMDKNAAMRNARTVMAATLNLGKLDGFKRLKDMGIAVRKKWIASHDTLTRDSHIEVDEEIVGLDEEFSNGVQYPGDPNGAPEEVYNCRCTMESVLDEFDIGDDVREYAEYDAELPDMSYSEWVKAHEEESTPKHFVAQGADLTNTWVRRPDKFEYEIEDIINAQGFDGLPRVVSREEFDKAVDESNFIAQRTYSAPDQETLDAYRDMLYNGKWYVDCSTGGASYGQGMYAIPSYNGLISDEMRQGMQMYSSRFGKNKYSYVETFTMASDSKIISSDKIHEMKKELERAAMEDLKKNGWNMESAMRWDSVIHVDDGSFAAMRGYDAVKVVKETNDYNEIIVLNRTKCIFLED